MLVYGYAVSSFAGEFEGVVVALLAGLLGEQFGAGVDLARCTCPGFFGLGVAKLFGRYARRLSHLFLFRVLGRVFQIISISIVVVAVLLCFVFMDVSLLE